MLVLLIFYGCKLGKTVSTLQKTIWITYKQNSPYFLQLILYKQNGTCLSHIHILKKRRPSGCSEKKQDIPCCHELGCAMG